MGLEHTVETTSSSRTHFLQSPHSYSGKYSKEQPVTPPEALVDASPQGQWADEFYLRVFNQTGKFSVENFGQG